MLYIGVWCLILPLMNKEAAEIIKNLEIDDKTTIEVIDSLTKHISNYYPDGTVGSYFEPNASTFSMIPMAGVSPIDAVLGYKGHDHVCYVTFFLGPKIGYELTFRIESDDTTFNEEFVNLLSNLANKHLRGEKDFSRDEIVFCDMGDWFGSDIKGLLFTKDPVLKELDLEIGKVEFIHAIGLTSFEIESITNEGALDENKAKEFLSIKLKADPMLKTRESG